VSLIVSGIVSATPAAVLSPMLTAPAPSTGASAISLTVTAKARRRHRRLTRLVRRRRHL